jgi:hypothetical protein
MRRLPTASSAASTGEMKAPDRRSGRIYRVPTVTIAQDPAADELLGRDPLALLLAMLLDQQFPRE